MRYLYNFTYRISKTLLEYYTEKRIEMASDLFKEASKYFSLEAIDTNNWSFKLFSKVTVGIFVASAVISAASSYSGVPIVCKDDNDYANQFCWIHGAQKIQKTLDSTLPKTCAGVISHHGDFGTEYYLWVSMMLFLNGVLFMIPDKIWQHFEDGLLEQFGSKRSEFLDNPQNERPPNENEANDVDGKHVEIYRGLSKNACRKYFYTFIACEMLNIVITIISFVLTNVFLSGRFFNYGSNVISYNLGYEECQQNPMSSLFPTVVNCEYSFYGTTGDPEKRSVICMLGQNILNQKIYFLIWVWFIVLFFVSAFVFIDRMMCIFVPAYQRSILASHIKSKNARSLTKPIPLGYEKNGKWFVLAQLGRNASPYKYRNFLEKLGERLEKENTRQGDQRIGNQDIGNHANVAINGANGSTNGDSNIVETTGTSQNQDQIAIDCDRVGNNSNQANVERIRLRTIAES